MDSSLQPWQRSMAGVEKTDAPDLQPPAVEGAGELTIPTRMIYPINEQTLNPANRAAAAAAIGGDESSTRLFWDVM
ncbi:hypothetical protein [uncultured Pontibacter sp.]|uniref:hypothetical protein n=1 Tax=uncultured Pontibacter sp. TaxID=453356 RepID=UPI00260AD9C8|nr:hypothetical protein [uncultured Pontibacter sp.]